MLTLHHFSPVSPPQKARLAKNYAEGDRLRLILQQAGITLIDLPNGEMMIIRPR